MTTNTVMGRSTTQTAGIRLRWAAAVVPAFTIGWAFAQVFGEVIGEAWGGDFGHLLGHTIGTVLAISIVSIGGWVVLRGRVAWVSRWAWACSLGAIMGLVIYVPILALAPDALGGLTIALTLHLPLIMATITQAVLLRGHMRHPGRWALAWLVGIVLAVAVAWFAGGGVEGASAGAVHPVFEKAAAYWLHMIPRSLFGAVIYALWTAITVPLGKRELR